MPIDFDEMHARSAECRKKNFRVEVGRSTFPEAREELVLSVTHNGHHWSSVILTPDEAAQVIKALQEATK